MMAELCGRQLGHCWCYELEDIQRPKKIVQDYWWSQGPPRAIELLLIMTQSENLAACKCLWRCKSSGMLHFVS